MLRSHRSTPEKLWSIGVRVGAGKDQSSIVARLQQPTCPTLGASQPHHHAGWTTTTKHLNYRAFTSGTTGLIKEQSTTNSPSSASTSRGQPHGTATTTTTTTTATNTVLVSAAKEAQRLSDLAAKCRPEKDASSAAATTTNSSTMGSTPNKTTTDWMKPSTLVREKIQKRDVDIATIQNALESAQALLFVTRLSSSLQDSIQNRPNASPEIQKQITSLHRAFLAVTSWCLDVVTMSHTPDPRMLDMALQVARRAHQLQLPFHMPLYIRLMNAVAEYYDPKQRPVGNSNNSNNNKKIMRNTPTAGTMILEIAGRATTMLGPAAIASSQFFREPLEALVRRRCYGDVAIVLRGIENQYSMLELDKGTLLKLLITLEITVSEDTDIANNWEETADVLEILNLADPYLWRTITALTSLSDIWNRKQDKNRQKREQLQRNMSSLMREKEEASQQRLLPVAPPPSPPSPPARTTTTEKLPTKRMRRKRSTQSYGKKDYDLYLFRGWIYNIDTPSERDALPDITAQIESFYNGRDFRYSEDLEREIMNRNMEVDEDSDDAGMNQMQDDLMFGDDLFSDDDYDDEFFGLSDISDDDDDDDDDDYDDEDSD